MSADNANSKADSSRLDASIFYFKWSKTALETYAATIKSNYLKVLVAHCTKARTSDEDGSIAFDYNELGSDPRVIRDDREDIKKRLEAWKNRQISDEGENRTNVPISLAELSCLYRLKTLIIMCEKLSEIMGRMGTWMDENKPLLKKLSSHMQIHSFTRKIFESVCGIGEVFRLMSLSWKTCKYSKFLEPSSNEYENSGNAELTIMDAKKYCPQLMSKINYFRTLVYIIGCSFTAMIETIFVKIASERCDIRSRQINAILKSLPPQYLFTKDYQKMTRRTSGLLETPPKNEHSFPLVSVKNKDDSLSVMTTQKSYKVESSKYKSNSTRRSAETLKTASKSQSKSNSKKSTSKIGKFIKKIVKKPGSPAKSDKKSAEKSSAEKA